MNVKPIKTTRSVLLHLRTHFLVQAVKTFVTDFFVILKVSKIWAVCYSLKNMLSGVWGEKNWLACIAGINRKRRCRGGENQCHVLSFHRRNPSHCLVLRVLRRLGITELSKLFGCLQGPPSGKTLALPEMSPCSSTAETASLKPSTKRAWYFFLAKSNRLHLSGTILHCPNNRCFSAPECLWHVRSSLENLSPSVAGCSLSTCTLFDLFCETLAKSPWENAPSKEQFFQ